MKRQLAYVVLLNLFLGVGAGCAKQEAQLQSAHGQSVEYWVKETKQPKPKARIQAIRVLQSVGAADPAAIPAIIRALKDRDAKVRDAAALALLNVGPPAEEAVDALNAAKADQDATVRMHAEAALNRITGGASAAAASN